MKTKPWHVAAWDMKETKVFIRKSAQSLAYNLALLSVARKDYSNQSLAQKGTALYMLLQSVVTEYWILGKHAKPETRAK